MACRSMKTICEPRKAHQTLRVTACTGYRRSSHLVLVPDHQYGDQRQLEHTALVAVCYGWKLS